MAAGSGAGLSAAAFLGTASHPPPSYYVPSGGYLAASPAAAAATAVPERKDDIVTGAKQFRATTDQIRGFSAVKQDDRDNLVKLIAFVTTLKCQSDDISSSSYDRPKWTRVETSDDADYTIIFGGWESLGASEFIALKHYDPKVGLYRNLVDFEVRTVKNNVGETEPFALIVRYQGEALRRRRIATERDETPMRESDDNDGSTHARKRTRADDDDDNNEPGIFTRAFKFLTSVD